MAEEAEAEGVYAMGCVSAEVGLLTWEGLAAEVVVLVVGACWGWAYRLLGWVARRTRRDGRRLERSEGFLVVGLVLAIAVKERK